MSIYTNYLPAVVTVFSILFGREDRNRCIHKIRNSLRGGDLAALFQFTNEVFYTFLSQLATTISCCGLMVYGHSTPSSMRENHILSHI